MVREGVKKKKKILDQYRVYKLTSLVPSLLKRSLTLSSLYLYFYNPRDERSQFYSRILVVCNRNNYKKKKSIEPRYKIYFNLHIYIYIYIVEYGGQGRQGRATKTPLFVRFEEQNRQLDER